LASVESTHLSLIEADKMETILAEIDAYLLTAVDGVNFCDMGRALVLLNPPQDFNVLQGGRTAGPSR
jgi:hypothetical protein